jgi:acetylornithine deacetylase/succinyl-diaminopimelate desuccinylase-like protein
MNLRKGRRQFRNIRQAVEHKRFRDEVERDESLNYMLRNTISLTMLGGSEQTNVIPPEAWANLDVRLLPRIRGISWNRFAKLSPTQTLP